MGHAFHACLKKELREQRFHALFIISAVPIAFTGGALLLDAMEIHMAMLSIDKVDYVEKTAVFCMFAAVLAMATDLTGGEWRRGSVHFLRRLPVSMRTVFSAKLFVFFFLAAFSLLCGLALSGTIYFVNQWVRNGNDQGRFFEDAHLRISSLLTDWQVHVFSFLFACLLLITLSCWIRRVGLSLLLWGVLLSVYMHVYHLLDDWSVVGSYVLITAIPQTLLDHIHFIIRPQAVNIYLILCTLSIFFLAYHSFARASGKTLPKTHNSSR